MGNRRDYVTVKGTNFEWKGRVYRPVGTNMWYAATLGSTGPGGNRGRLCRELDSLRAHGIDNLRVMAGAIGSHPDSTRVWPSVQIGVGQWDERLLEGLDFLLAELERRQMTCVLYLNNAWDWSGGFATWLRWVGVREPLEAQPSLLGERTDTWTLYQQHRCRYWLSPPAQQLTLQYINKVVGRRNTITGRPYSHSPAIMAWQLCNEPRPFARSKEVKEGFLHYLHEQAKAIKRLDGNHLLSTGSEGKYGCETDMELYERLHALPEIDYLCIHFWPYNWNCLGGFYPTMQQAREKNGISSPQQSVEKAKKQTLDYVQEHALLAEKLQKPLVLEEYGYPRDAYALQPGSPTTARDEYFRFVLSLPQLAATNFWAWGGETLPSTPNWRMGQPYTGDPAQEEQGLNSVFLADRSTLEVIRRAQTK